MKKNKVEKLAFKKIGVLELNGQQLMEINAGGITTNGSISDQRTITTTSLNCRTEDGALPTTNP
ncbi:hypothetical protein NAT51_17820 [Flavobacterium amniphilum]|uniref:hypothetical protein n=1 Tax=Flavobacterium amniphilum TaxID=1834035 RepID=UPI00202A2038|nr:hypothetical protein [Flavobacterium amniphilum]MCL9807390.1 hypothetical protein [Flavobacterium amniphilum]